MERPIVRALIANLESLKRLVEQDRENLHDLNHRNARQCGGVGEPVYLDEAGEARLEGRLEGIQLALDTLKGMEPDGDETPIFAQ
jgi:hypothetical protein